MLIRLRQSREDEISSFVDMERLEGTSEFIIPSSKESHLDEFLKNDVHYLSILSNDSLVGFIILVVESDTNSVEFRRIVVASKGQGIGQSAIHEMEKYCAQTLTCGRIWLDVFKSNNRGKHIYEKLGYKTFRTDSCDGKVLLFLEKKL